MVGFITVRPAGFLMIHTPCLIKSRFRSPCHPLPISGEG